MACRVAGSGSPDETVPDRNRLIRLKSYRGTDVHDRGNSVDPDQTVPLEQSDLGLYYWLMDFFPILRVISAT